MDDHVRVANREVWPDGESPEDVESLRDRLVEWMTLLSKASGEPAQGDADALTACDWNRAVETASEHLECGLVGCTEPRCRRKALAFSLLEVCLYHQSVHGPEGQLRRGLTAYLQRIDGAVALAGLRSAAVGLAESDSERMAVELTGFGDETVWRECVETIDDARALVERLEKVLTRLSSREPTLPLANLRYGGRGRRRGHLLPSVWGYLREVGVEWQEIAVRLSGAPAGPSDEEQQRRADEAKRLADRFARAPKSKSFSLKGD